MKRASYFLLPLVALFLSACGKVAGPDARERELSYLRCVIATDNWIYLDDLTITTQDM